MPSGGFTDKSKSAEVPSIGSELCRERLRLAKAIKSWDAYSP